MKAILKLIQNELIKIYHQISWKILTIFALVISVAFPLLKFGFENIEQSYNYDYRELASYEEKGSYREQYFLSQAEADDFFTEKGLTSESWQHRYYYGDYLNTCSNLKAMELIIADEKMSNLVDVIEAFYVDGMERVWEGDKQTDKYTYQERIYDNYTGQITYGEAQDFTPELARRLRQKFTSEKTKLEKQINSKFSLFLNDKFKELKKQYQDAQNELNTVEAIYSNNKSVINRYQTAKMKAEGLKALLQAEQNLSYADSLTSQRQTSLLSAISYVEDTVINYCVECAAVSRENFDAEGGAAYYRGVNYTDYDQYLAAVQRQQDIYYQAINQYCYSISHNIPIADFDDNSARKHLAEALSVNMSVIMFLTIFLSSVIVANEHTSGAIRLLMIRPRARWKILLSKLVCIITYFLALTVATSLLTTLIEVIIYGGSDLNVPYLLTSKDTVKEISPLYYYIYRNAAAVLPSVLAACVGFLLSVLAKRGVLALAISMLVNVFGALVSQVAYNFIISAAWLKLTPIPYFTLSDAFPEPMNLCHDWQAPHNYGISFGAGIAVLLIYSFIMLILSFVIFKKEQIKN